ncbi:uncharacterized protein LOC115886201 [Sitophilus oryzae]|uniref:Uncharacterized protein LOC115886201 n=1 Tax=Sitophilus oryzae TaxID=7048 RepID=A0A6J2YCT9_SITOR|nr:uncharacterized protein LOC115886201 [Sitophilus oryzae]
MSLSVDIPEINITSENEDNEEHSSLHLAEQLTDLEDLYEDKEDESTVISPIKRKSNLKIRLPNYGPATDTENFETSSDENDTEPIIHNEPLSLQYVDFEIPLTEECYQKPIKNVKGKKKLKTQFSTKQRNFYQFVSQNKCGEDTDSETYETEHEVIDKVPDSELNLGLYQCRDFTHDNIDNCNESLSYFDDNRISNSISLPLINLTLTDQELFTDTEDIGSEFDSNKQVKKYKKSRHRHRPTPDMGLTDVENIYFSDDSRSPKKKIQRVNRKYKRAKNQTGYQLLESDNEDTDFIPFPICKRVTRKNKLALKLPSNDVMDLTDEENFQSDVEFDESEAKVVDEKALDERLRELATCYSHVKEAANKLKMKSKFRPPIKDSVANKSDSGDTDEDKFQVESSDECEEKYTRDEMSFKIKFSVLNSNLGLESIRAKEEYPPTDYENIDSSSDGGIRHIPYALVQKDMTDEEDFSDDNSITDYYPSEVELPPPVRNLVLVQENDSLVPTIKILPLESDYIHEEKLENIEAITDEENLSDFENSTNLNIIDEWNRAPTPELPILEGGSVNVLESINSATTKLSIKESCTDTEELILERRQRRKRAPKFKYLHEKCMNSKKLLTVAPYSEPPLTDTEEVYLSDGNKIKQKFTNVNRLHVAQSNDGTLTDTEHIDLSDDQDILSQNIKEIKDEVVISNISDSESVSGGEDNFDL